MTTLLFDEIDKLKASIGTKTPKQAKDEIIDLLVLAYGLGCQDACLDLGKDLKNISGDKMYDTIYKKIAGKDVSERIDEYVAQGDVPAIQKVIETEAIRDYNTGVLNQGKTSGARFKTWITRMDDRVRDSHAYLQGMKVGIDDEFYTYDGDHAKQPGGFESPENNCNCRCTLKVTGQ